MCYGTVNDTLLHDRRYEAGMGRPPRNAACRSPCM